MDTTYPTGNCDDDTADGLRRDNPCSPSYWASAWWINPARSNGKKAKWPERESHTPWITQNGMHKGRDDYDIYIMLYNGHISDIRPLESWTLKNMKIVHSGTSPPLPLSRCMSVSVSGANRQRAASFVHKVFLSPQIKPALGLIRVGRRSRLTSPLFEPLTRKILAKLSPQPKPATPPHGIKRASWNFIRSR